MADQKPKKRVSREPVVVDAKVIESARKIIFEPQPRKTFKCRVCGEPGATDESEGLCWVCRRLKISAWKEVELQSPLNE